MTPPQQCEMSDRSPEYGLHFGHMNGQQPPINSWKHPQDTCGSQNRHRPESLGPSGSRPGAAYRIWLTNSPRGYRFHVPPARGRAGVINHQLRLSNAPGRSWFQEVPTSAPALAERCSQGRPGDGLEGRERAGVRW